MNSNPVLDAILDALFMPYRERVPDVKIISNAMIDNGMISDEKDIVNDHIAFRTLGVSHLGIDSFERIFLHHGYKKMDYYHFEQKRLDAYWYAPPSPKYPRIFLSELRVKDLSKPTQSIIEKYTSGITSDPVDSIDLENAESVGRFFYNPLWHLPTKEDYIALLEESEYAAWVIYNRYYLNHYTISVHELPNGYDRLEKFNQFLVSIGIRLNVSGGVIKTSKDGLLRQTSTVAKMVDAEFANKEKMSIAGSYVEFAERAILEKYKSLPKEAISSKHRRDGFEAGNADKIFESTYTDQTKA